MKMLRWSAEDLGMTMLEEEIPASERQGADRYRERMLERVVELDDRVLAEYLEGREPSVEDLQRLIRMGTLRLKFFPVLCGAALRNQGVQPLLTAVVRYLPSPLDIPPVTGYDPVTQQKVVRPANPSSPLTALVFKVQSDPERRRIFYLRLYSGTLTDQAVVYNPRLQQRVKIARLLRMHANRRERIAAGSAGEIVAVIGLKGTVTGDTICDEEHPIVLESMIFPEPVIFVAIEPRTVLDQDKLDRALQLLAEEDPTFRVRSDPETGQTIISGMGELHLEILVERLIREFQVQARVGKPQVAYRESIRQRWSAEVKYIKIAGGIPHHAHVIIEVEPNRRGGGIDFVNQMSPEKMPPPFAAAIEESIRGILANGIQLGYPIVDIVIRLVGGSFNPDISTDWDFRFVAPQAFREACLKAEPILLEPIMKLECLVPSNETGGVIGHLHAHRGEIIGLTMKKDLQVIHALAPLAELFGYATQLRSLTQGRGTFTLQVSHYAEVPTSRFSIGG